MKRAFIGKKCPNLLRVAGLAGQITDAFHSVHVKYDDVGRGDFGIFVGDLAVADRTVFEGVEFLVGEVFEVAVFDCRSVFPHQDNEVARLWFV